MTVTTPAPVPSSLGKALAARLEAIRKKHYLRLFGCAACQPGMDAVLVRHAFALIPLVLMARLAGAGDATGEQVGDTLDSARIDCLIGGDGFVGYCRGMSEGRFCPPRLSGRYRTWYYQTDALLLHRTNGRSRPLAVSSDSLAPVLDAGDLDLGFRPGLRLLLGHRLGVDRGWELSYFGFFDRASIAMAEPNNLDIAGTLRNVLDDYSGADRITFRHAGTLHHAEANLVSDGETWSGLAGLRFLHVNDTAVLTATDRDSGTSNYAAHSQNDLFGPQVGFRTGRFNRRWGWEFTTKTGLLANLMRQQQLLLDDDNMFVRRRDSASLGSTTLFGDLNVSCFRQLNDVWSIRGGYFLLYVANVALAVDQLDLGDPPASKKTVIGSDLLLHGITLGLEARW